MDSITNLLPRILLHFQEQCSAAGTAAEQFQERHGPLHLVVLHSSTYLNKERRGGSRRFGGKKKICTHSIDGSGRLGQAQNIHSSSLHDAYIENICTSFWFVILKDTVCAFSDVGLLLLVELESNSPDGSRELRYG